MHHRRDAALGTVAMRRQPPSESRAPRSTRLISADRRIAAMGSERRAESVGSPPSIASRPSGAALETSARIHPPRTQRSFPGACDDCLAQNRSPGTPAATVGIYDARTSSTLASNTATPEAPRFRERRMLKADPQGRVQGQRSLGRRWRRSDFRTRSIDDHHRPRIPARRQTTWPLTTPHPSFGTTKADLRDQS